MSEHTNDLVREVLGDDHPVPFGWLMMLELYNFGDNFVDKQGKETLFERPDLSKDRDQYQLGVGRILMLGDACFKGPQFTHVLRIPQIGEYISFYKYQGTLKPHGGKPVMYIKDYDFFNFEPDPSKSGYMNLVTL